MSTDKLEADCSEGDYPHPCGERHQEYVKAMRKQTDEADDLSDSGSGSGAVSASLCSHVGSVHMVLHVCVCVHIRLPNLGRLGLWVRSEGRFWFWLRRNIPRIRARQNATGGVVVGRR